METITFLITLSIKDGVDNEKLRETMAQLATSVSKKPGARFYQSFQREEGNKLEFIETFSDSASALHHLKNQDESLASFWFSMIELDAIVVIGPASDALRAELAGYPIVNKPVYADTISGFAPKS